MDVLGGSFTFCSSYPLLVFHMAVKAFKHIAANSGFWLFTGCSLTIEMPVNYIFLLLYLCLLIFFVLCIVGCVFSCKVLSFYTLTCKAFSCCAFFMQTHFHATLFCANTFFMPCICRKSILTTGLCCWQLLGKQGSWEPRSSSQIPNLAWERCRHRSGSHKDLPQGYPSSQSTIGERCRR